MNKKRSRKCLTEQYLPVKIKVAALKYIEDNTLYRCARMCIEPASYRTHSNFRRLVLRKMKYAGGDAAERNGFQLMIGGKRKNRPIAGGQQLFILPGEPPGYDRSDSVNDEVRRKIISRRIEFIAHLNIFLLVSAV